MQKLYITAYTTILVLVFLISSCNGGSNKKKISFSPDSLSIAKSRIKDLIIENLAKTNINNDSVELTALMRNLYKWHETELKDTNAYDFPTTKTD